MNTAVSIHAQRCLLIFDPHQDVEWIQTILTREEGNFTHLVLGGDYWDPSSSASSRRKAIAMCELLLKLREEHQNRLTVLLGNHDIHYLEATKLQDLSYTWRMMNTVCSRFRLSTAKEIKRRLRPDFWARCRLFQVVNGWIVSHAGLAGRFWPQGATIEESLEKLDETCKTAIARVHLETHQILRAGRIRRGTDASAPQGDRHITSGDEDVGGIVWHDFNFEFSDDDGVPLPQIFGHTVSNAGARKKGRSWCLDGDRTCYGILHADGELEIRTTN